jgi:hypothetical protein
MITNKYAMKSTISDHISSVTTPCELRSGDGLAEMNVNVNANVDVHSILRFPRLAPRVDQ